MYDIDEDEDDDTDGDEYRVRGKRTLDERLNDEMEAAYARGEVIAPPTQPPCPPLCPPAPSASPASNPAKPSSPAPSRPATPSTPAATPSIAADAPRAPCAATRARFGATTRSNGRWPTGRSRTSSRRCGPRTAAGTWARGPATCTGRGGW